MLVWYDCTYVLGLVLNCVRMLIRIIPFLFEHAQWRDLFWSPIALSEVKCVSVSVCACICACLCTCMRASVIYMYV